MTPNIKVLNPVLSDKKILENGISKPIFWPNYLVMQSNETVYLTYVGDCTWIVPLKMDKNQISATTDDDDDRSPFC